MPPELHPLTEKYPLMEADEFAAFKADLAEHGQKNPIWLFEGKVLDGRNRLRACHELGLEPLFAEFKGSDSEAEAFVDSQNLHRRHLSREWRQKQVLEMRAQGKSYRAIAKELGTSVGIVHLDANSGVQLRTPESIQEECSTGAQTRTPSPSCSSRISGVAKPTLEPSEPAEPARETPRIKGRDGKSYQAQRPATPKPKPAPPAKAQWTELASILSELAQKVENLVPTPEENDRPWELIKSLETTAASLLRQAERLRRRHHL